MTKLDDLLAYEVVEGLTEGQFTAEEYVISILKRIEEVEPKVHSFITLDTEGALSSAKTIDKKIREKEDIGQLAGVAVGIKDNISTQGIKTTCASKILENYVPTYDATVIRNLKENGAILLGKLNLDEFGMGSTTEYSRYHPTHNPWNLDYVPGGSSGGSGAAVAAGECTVALGSDTGGSIRCPSSFCSVVGLKPTYGRVSRSGLISYANSLEQIGPICRSVKDLVMMLNIISGKDAMDNTSMSSSPITVPDKSNKLNVAVIKELITGSDQEVAKSVYSASEKFQEIGCSCEEVSIKNLHYALPSYYTLASAEASSNLARYDNIRYGFDYPIGEYKWDSYFSNVRENFGEEVKRRILIGSYVLSSGYYGKYYLKARRLRSLLRLELLTLFKKYDLLIGPTMPILPFKFGEKIDDPIKMYLVDVNTVIANLAGIPAISLPIGFSNGLPIGLQIMAAPFEEQKLIDTSYGLEKVINIQRRPNSI
ncbi:MAG TPA: Asp-tRNA(Asn)/Glu-tRNA(Gln) amidotransferase subunit GatA [Nitrososphaeraceae archaeon]|jgi:aspartyl-tRNA(Asn)/glutamyl-tRNA(Gln) amidotransferase subunit A|nr:Asp-tRNA(Asn)/Glu-tRNA(Gln) amidotransferase subunit GatA [Nitrososphaeraceae archaeon]